MKRLRERAKKCDDTLSKKYRKIFDATDLHE